MRHTLVAAFDTLEEARAAKSQLVNKNIREVDIKASGLDTDRAEMRTGGSDRDQGNDESFGDKVSEFFSSLFGDDDNEQPHRHASAYPEAYRRGAAVVTVKAANDEQAEEIEAILERNGAIDIDERSATWDGEGETRHIAGTHIADKGKATGASAEKSIPVINEDLRVGKREVEKGRVRVVSRVSEQPVEETVRLHEEHAHIERRPVDRAAKPEELNSFKSGSLEIKETEEQPVVEKTARVVEEVMVGKEASDHEETVRDTVRRTDVEIEKDPARGSAMADKTSQDRVKR